MAVAEPDQSHTYGGVATSEAQAALRATGQRIQSQVEHLKTQILEGTVELSTLGTIGSFAMLVVSTMAILGNLARLSPVSALLMVYCAGGAVALLSLEFSANPPSWLPASAVQKLRALKQRLHFECHILTVMTGRALVYLFFGSILLADAGSALGAGVGAYLAFVGLAMLYVSRSAVSKLRALYPSAAESELRSRFARHDSNGNGVLSKAEFATLCGELGEDMTARELECAIALLDVDGSGNIDVEEFVAWYGGNNWQRALYVRDNGAPASSMV